MFKVVVFLLLLANAGFAQVVSNIPPPTKKQGRLVPKSKYENNSKIPVIPYNHLSEKAFFLNSPEENSKDIMSYVYENISENEKSIEFTLGGKIILGENGNVLDIVFYYCRGDEFLIKKVKSILKNMPRWKKSGMYKENKVRVVYSFYLKSGTDPQD